MKMHLYRNFIFVLVFLFVGIVELNAAILLVPSETYPTIQSAIDAADPNDTVQVAPGYYPENIVFPGYDITLTAYDPNCYVETIISAEDSGTVVTFNGGETNACILRGFTITRGLAGGIRAVNSSPTIQRCHIVRNADTNSRAAGIFLAGNCSPMIYDTSVVSNYNAGSPGSGTQGMGGIYCYDGVNLTLINCSFIYNGNPANPENFAQIYCHTSHISAINCLIWNLFINEIIEDAGTVTARYCDIEGGWPGIGNIDQNPENLGSYFSRCNFHLEHSSPCIDRGDPNTQFILSAYDPDGDPRIHNGRIDIGADEFVDTDADWLPDCWEKKFFVSSTAAETYGNPDNDAYVNHEEYSMNTNPITTHIYVNDSTGSDAWNGAAPVWDGQHGPCKTIMGGMGRLYSGDTLLVAPGIYQGYNNRDINLWQELTVKSTDGPETCIIDCQGSAADPHGGFTISKDYGSTEPDAVLEGFTIKNGYSASVYSPAGISIYGTSPTIRNCIITENTFELGHSDMTGGAGIRCMYNHPNPAPHPQIIDCEISHNRTNQYGGGIFADDNSYLTLNRCLIHHNEGPVGGIAAYQALIQSSTIADNTNYGIFDFWSYQIQVWYSICWNNGSNSASFLYSDVEGNTQASNFDADPLFADPVNDDYHLKSQAGRWDPQLQMWVYDSVSSTCIDRAHPDDGWTAELWPRGKRKNLGFYGGTPEASMSLSLEGNPADLNLDDKVNLADYYLWTLRWLTQQHFLHEDFNRNGLVDAPDACIFADNWLWSKPYLIAYWNMDETDGDIAHDQSVYSVHGTLHGDADWTAGHINNALALDGSGDYVELGNSDILKPELPITFSVWIKLISYPDYQTIVSLDQKKIDLGYSYHTYGTELLVSNVGKIILSYGDGQTNYQRRYKIGTTQLSIDTWYHIAGVIRGPDDMDIYIDGNNDNGTISGGGVLLTYTNEGSSYLGCRNGSDYFFHGLLDDVRIYNKDLTEDEIRSLADN